MPIYEYRCDECGFQKEFLQKISDAPLTDCPQCGKPALTKLLSAAGFQLKGTGWYATDFKNGGSKGGTKTDSGKPVAKAEGGKSSGKDDSASGAKTESKPAGGAGTTSADSGS